MKISHITTENLDINEALPFTKQWGRERQAKKDVKADISDMTSDLKTWMSGSRLKNVTIDQFKNFLSQKGLDPTTVDDLANARTSGRTGIDPDAPMTSAEVKQYIGKAVAAGYQARGASGTRSRFAGSSAPAAGSGGGSSLPSAITSALSSLTPAQKAALKGML